MNLFNRLFHIARANVGRAFTSSSGPHAGAGRRHEEASHAGQERARDHGAADRDAASGRDPELAACYAALELPYGADLDSAKKAWKNLLRKYHPDLHAHDPEKRRVAQELTQGLNEAYATLKRRQKD